jgi:hypothetical protein
MRPECEPGSPFTPPITAPTKIFSPQKKKTAHGFAPKMQPENPQARVRPTPIKGPTLHIAIRPLAHHLRDSEPFARGTYSRQSEIRRISPMENQVLKILLVIPPVATSMSMGPRMRAAPLPRVTARIPQPQYPPRPGPAGYGSYSAAPISTAPGSRGLPF